MKNCKIVLALLCAVSVLASCGRKTVVSGHVDGLGESSQVIVKMLDVNTFLTLDTLKTSADGAFTRSFDIEEGNPQFIYLFYGQTKIASLLLFSGDKVSVEADTLGSYTLEGSPESLLLQEVEKQNADFASSFGKIVEGGDNAEITKAYIAYYRQCVTFLMNNPHSLTCIPVLYQQLAANFPVFSQYTDAIHFRRVCDSLKVDYPQSKYVKALEKEASRRESLLQLNTQMSDARQVGYPALEMNDQRGKKVSLDSLDAKVILVHFWTATDAVQKMFNLDVLKPLYSQYHSKGLEIYSVCIDTDKATWAATVKNQELPWINVCDGLGASSPAIALYNVRSVPTSYVISGGALYDTVIKGESDLKKTFEKLLK